MDKEVPATKLIQDMGQLLDSMQPLKPLVRGDVVQGVVMGSTSDGILVNVGHKTEGLVPTGEMKSIARLGKELPEIGDDILAYVLKGETAEDAAILSVDRALSEGGWSVVEKAYESGEVVKGTILGFNRGGCIVDVAGVQGFVPMSQLFNISNEEFRGVQQSSHQVNPIGDLDGGGDSESNGVADSNIAVKDNPYIEKEVELKVLEVHRGRNRVILSERQAVEGDRDEAKAKMLKDLSEGEVRKGRVTGISSFGAFVDLGGIDGLVHISELSWNTVRSPDEVVKVGDEVNTFVLKVDEVNKRIALSIKRLEPEPWETINEKFQVGDVVEAEVTNLTEFGAFARIKDSVEGLIHISEMSPRMIRHPREVVNEGDEVKLKIIKMEPDRRRVALSLVQAIEDEY